MLETTLGLLRTGRVWLEDSCNRQSSMNVGQEGSSHVQGTEMKARETNTQSAREWGVRRGRGGRNKHRRANTKLGLVGHSRNSDVYPKSTGKALKDFRGAATGRVHLETFPVTGRVASGQ